MPMRPATAPDSSIEMTTIRLTSTPAATAADSERPVARRLKPKRVSLSSTWKAMPTTTARISRP